MPDEADKNENLLKGPLSVSILGARHGDLVRARDDETSNGKVLMKIVGYIGAQRFTEEDIEAQVPHVARHYQISHELARRELEDLPRDPQGGGTGKPPGHTMGKGCLCDNRRCRCGGSSKDTARFILLDIGNWRREYEGEEGVDIAALDAAIESGQPKSWFWIQGNLGLHTLQMRRSLYTKVKRNLPTDDPAAGRSPIDLSRTLGTESIGWINPPNTTFTIHSPKTRPTPWTERDSVTLCEEVCVRLLEECPAQHHHTHQHKHHHTHSSNGKDAITTSLQTEISKLSQKDWAAMKVDEILNYIEYIESTRGTSLVEEKRKLTTNPQPDAETSLLKESLHTCWSALKAATMGELKSAHQKVVRRGIPFIHLSEFNTTVPSWVYASMCIAQLICRPNVFDPELGISLRGSVSALKRMSVILCEDALHEQDGVQGVEIEAMLAAALLCQLDVDYHPCGEIVEMCMRTTARAVWSRHAVEWHRCGRERSNESPDTVRFPLTEEARSRWVNSAGLLAHIKSLSGDIKMLNDVASHLQRFSWLPVRVQPQSIVKALSDVSLPDTTTTDQHCYRGIGHLLSINGGTDFLEMFRSLFRHVTGINPRRDLPPELTLSNCGGAPWNPMASEFFKQAALAQWFALHPPCIDRQKELPLLQGASIELRTPLHPGELAGGVGHVYVKVSGKGEYIVVLGADVPEDETVMLAPSRVKCNVFDVPDDVKQTAIRIVRGRTLTPRFCQYASLRSKRVRFLDGKWHLGDLPWLEGWVGHGLRTEFPLHPPWSPHSTTTSATHKSPPEEEDNDITDALQYRGNGMVQGARDTVLSYCKATPLNVLQRLVDVMQQATTTTVSLPVPGMDGGMAPGALKAPAPHDPKVYRVMCILSRLVPGALRACKPPQFKIPSSVLFHHLREWVREVYAEMLGLGRTAQMDWNDVVDNSAKLYPFQTRSVGKMQRGLPTASHFLCASTGSGKTPMAAEHMRLNAIRIGAYAVLWIAPKNLVTSTLELLRKWNYPACEVECRKRKRLDDIKKAIQPCKYNVIDSDFLHQVVENLLPLAPQLLVVVDEVDRCYGSTKRSASAFRIANSALSVLAMTATAIRKQSDPLAEWLNLTEPYPVNSKNYLVSMSKAVNVELDLGITKVYEERIIPMSEEVRGWCLNNPRDWSGMEAMVRRCTDDALVGVVVEECRRETTLYTTADDAADTKTTNTAPSGVLLVAWNQTHVDKLVASLEARGVRAGAFHQRDDTSLEVLVVVCRNARGYNSAIRFGCLVTGVYPGNAADRQQMQGRLSRIGQCRKELRFVTVLMRNSILHLLHERQLVAANTNASIQALGEKYSAQILHRIASASSSLT